MNSYHANVLSVIKSVRAFFTTNFTTITVDGPKLDASSLGTTPLMLVSTHRSHIDYFFIGYIFHQLGIKNLRFAAGDNLTRLPWIGKKFTNFGAFTIERDTSFNRNYVRDLCNNVVSMIESGDTVLVFPEGGRSYTGSMLEMRLGILGASVISQARNTDRDVHYIPMAVSYESPPDVPWFSLLLKGKTFRKRSNSLYKRFLGNLFYFGADIGAFLPLFLPRLLKPTHGAIFLDYGEPVSVRSILDIEAAKNSTARDEFSMYRSSMQKLSEAVFDQLTRLYRILPSHVVAALVKQNNGGSIASYVEKLPELIDSLRSRGRNVKQLERSTPLENVQEGIRQLRRHKAITVKGNICSVRKESLVNYFAATVM